MRPRVGSCSTPPEGERGDVVQRGATLITSSALLSLNTVPARLLYMGLKKPTQEGGQDHIVRFMAVAINPNSGVCVFFLNLLNDDIFSSFSRTSLTTLGKKFCDLLVTTHSSPSWQPPWGRGWGVPGWGRRGSARVGMTKAAAGFGPVTPMTTGLHGSAPERRLPGGGRQGGCKGEAIDWRFIRVPARVGKN